LWEQELVAEIKRYIQKRRDMTVLEIGCSNGRWLRWFKREYDANVFGIDTSLAGAASVENFILADGLHLPLRENTFDVVFSMGLIEHFESSMSRRKLIEEHVRVAERHAGIVWIEHPNMDFSLSYVWTKLYYDRRQGYRHYRLTRNETKKHLRTMNIEILAACLIGWFPPKLTRLFPLVLDLSPSALSRRFPAITTTLEKVLLKKIFEHQLTAENFLVIGRRTI